MARQEIPLQDQKVHEVIQALPTAADAANGMFVKNNGFVKIIAVGGTATNAVVTIKSTLDSNRRLGDIVFTIGIDEVFESSFFESSIFNSGGSLEIDMDSDTDLTFSAIRQAV